MTYRKCDPRTPILVAIFPVRVTEGDTAVGSEAHTKRLIAMCMRAAECVWLIVCACVQRERERCVVLYETPAYTRSAVVTFTFRNSRSAFVIRTDLRTNSSSVYISILLGFMQGAFKLIRFE